MRSDSNPRSRTEQRRRRGCAVALIRAGDITVEQVAGGLRLTVADFAPDSPR